MHAVGISLGSSNAVVAVAAVTAAESTASIRVTANSAGHRTTPAMAAFAKHGELLFGQDARALYARTPDVVVPYLFAFAAVAEEHRRHHGRNATGLRHGIEEAGRRYYKGHCPLVDGWGDKSQRLGFSLPNANDKDEGENENHAFFAAEDLLVEFFNHVKKHTVDGACGLTATTENVSSQESPSSQEEQPKIILSVVVPRHLFLEAATRPRATEADDGNDNNCGHINSDAKGTQRCDAVQWVRDAVLASHFGAVAAHVSVLFSDEAALLAMDAVPCRPHPAHSMGNRYFLLPPSASSAAGDTLNLLPWPSARVLVVDWGALGVSLTRLQLEGGCLVDEPRSFFLRTSQTAADVHREELGLAVTPCGGGDAVNLALCERLAATFAQQQFRVLGYRSLSDFPARAQRRLLLAAEDKKTVLSKATQAPVEIEALVEGIDLRDNVTFSRVRVDAALRGEWKLLEAFENVLTEYLQLLAQEFDGVIDAVVLCGGMLQMPYVAQSLRQLFTQRAVAPGEGRRFFAHNLVIMEAGVSTTVVAVSQESNGPSSSVQTVTNSTTFGAEELFCVGACLHSYQLALAALQNRDYAGHHSAMGGKKKTKRVLLSRRKQERAEEARRVWLALAQSDGDDICGDDQSFREVVVLQRSIFLYAHSSLDALRLAVARQKTEKEPLQLPTEALSVLFAAHTPLPSRVVVPVRGGTFNPLVLYLFTECQQPEEQLPRRVETSAEEQRLSSVLPLTDTGVQLVDAGDEKNGEEWQHCVVLTLREGVNNSTHSAEAKTTTSSLQMVVQLVRTAANASLPLALSPTDVQATLTLDI